MAWNSWEAFRNERIGKGVDTDGAFGYQCWDLGSYFWKGQVGRNLITRPGGNGYARDCWEISRATNAGGQFDYVLDRNAIKPGDWIVFGGTTAGHIGMAVSGNLGGYVRLLGQNQRGTPYSKGGSTANEINMSLNNFLGAFRLKAWHVAPAPTPKPTPTPAPKPTPMPTDETYTIRKGDTFWGLEEAWKIPHGTLQALNPGVDPRSLAIGQSIRIRGTAPAPAPAPSPAFKVGDRVVPTRLVSWEGVPLTQWDNSYTISELNGKRAVLVARGAVWAALSTDNIRKA